MFILKYAIIYLSIILGSIGLSIILKKRTTSCIPIDILLKILLIYIFGLVNQLKIGVYVALFAPIIFGIILLIKNIKNEEIKKNILSPGFLFFTFIFFLFCITTYEKQSDAWDEYSYWSWESKRMFFDNNLISYSDTRTFIIYPPIPTIWQYFFTRTLNTYSQGIEIFATNIFGFALLLPLFEKINSNSSKIVKACLSIIIVCIPCIFDYLMFYSTIYADAILGLLIGYILYQLYNEKDKKVLYITLGLAFAVLSITKATGFYIAIILAVCIIIQRLVNIILNNKNKIKKAIIENKKEFILPIILICIALVTLCSWKIIEKNATVENSKIFDRDETDKHTLDQAIKSAFTGFLSSSEDTYAIEISNRTLVNNLYSQKCIVTPIQMSLATYIIFMIFVDIYLYKKIVKTNDKKKYIENLIITKTGLVLYIIALQFAYTTQFGVSEMIRHASLNRYINSYLLAELIWIISVVLDNFDITVKNVKKKYIIITLIILLFTPVYMITEQTIFSSNTNMKMELKLCELREETEKLKEIVPENSKIYIVGQNIDQTSDLWKIRYYMMPEFNVDITTKITQELEEKYKDNGKNLKEEFKKLLEEKYDYIYITNSDKYFDKFVSGLFNIQLEEKGLYKINKNSSGNMELEKVLKITTK